MCSNLRTFQQSNALFNIRKRWIENCLQIRYCSPSCVCVCVCVCCVCVYVLCVCVLCVCVLCVCVCFLCVCVCFVCVCVVCVLCVCVLCVCFVCVCWFLLYDIMDSCRRQYFSYINRLIYRFQYRTYW